MKKVFFLVISSFCLFFSYYFFYINYAYTIGTVYLESNKKVIEVDEEIEIVVMLESVKTVAFTGYLYFDNSKLEYISELENVNIVDNHIVFMWYDSTGGNGSKQGELIRFKFRAKENGITTFNIDGEFYDDNEQLIQIGFKELQIQIGNDNTKMKNVLDNDKGTNLESNNVMLKSLMLDIEGLSPKFEKDIKEYYLTISNKINDIEVFAVSENPNATVGVSGNTNLKDGLNLITIQVISEDKTQNSVYNINVTKTADLELANSNLEILVIENILLYPSFDANITNYNIEVSNEISKLNIFAVPENENATVQINGSEELKEGNNLINVVVSAQNGFSKKVYKINAYKRNQEEENRYKEEQEENKKKLEDIYQMEKTGSQSLEEMTESKRQNLLIGKILIVFCIILIAFLVFKYRGILNFKNKN